MSRSCVASGTHSVGVDWEWILVRGGLGVCGALVARELTGEAEKGEEEEWAGSAAAQTREEEE